MEFFLELAKLMKDDPMAILAVAAVITGEILAANRATDYIKGFLSKAFKRRMLPIVARSVSFVIAAVLAVPVLIAGEYPYAIWVLGIVWAAISGPWFHDQIKLAADKVAERKIAREEAAEG